MRRHSRKYPGLLLLDQSLIPIFLNPVAHRMFGRVSHQDTNEQPGGTLALLITQFTQDLRLWHQRLPMLRRNDQQTVTRRVQCHTHFFRLQGYALSLGALPHQNFFIVTYTPMKHVTSPSCQPWKAFSRLRTREKDIVMLLTQRHTAPEMAQELGISVNTVKGYLKTLRVKARAHHHEHILDAFRPFDDVLSERDDIRKEKILMNDR